MKEVIIFLLIIYKRFLSPFLFTFFGASCRYNPTCSEYSLGAIKRFGLMRGSFLSIKRLSKCHPFSKVNFDPIPLKFP